MKPTFLNCKKPLLTTMIQKRTPGEIIATMQKAIPAGAEAFGIQIDQLERQYHREEVYREIFAAMEGRPVYVTYYRGNQNGDRPDEELAEGLHQLANAGATLCDVMSDFYAPHPDQVATDETAVKRQMKLIEELHGMGAEVLVSAHFNKYATPARVLEAAQMQKERGADIAKIVINADTAEQQIEHFGTIELLKRELGIPYLFLTSNHCHFVRRIGPLMGVCMYLCVYEHDVLSTPMQPLLHQVKAIRDNFALFESEEA
jgi:3-dehydroquinate dehydratase